MTFPNPYSSRVYLLGKIVEYTRRTGMTEEEFGNRTVGDADLVFSIRKGTRQGPKRRDKIVSYMEANPVRPLTPLEEKPLSRPDQSLRGDPVDSSSYAADFREMATRGSRMLLVAMLSMGLGHPKRGLPGIDDRGFKAACRKHGVL